MNNPTDVYTLRQAETLLKKSQHTNTAPTSEGHTLTFANLPEEHTSDDLFSYEIFHNAASGYQTGAEYLTLGDKADCCQRWLAYYPPDTQQLPQQKNLQRLLAQSETLTHEAAALKSPRLAITTLCMVIGLFLLFSNNPTVAIIPFLIMMGMWVYSAPGLLAHQQKVNDNTRLMKSQLALLKRLKTEAEHLPVAATESEMQDAFSQTLHDFLISSVQHYVPAISEERLIQNLHEKRTKIFMLASSAMLQATSLCQTGETKAPHPSLENRLQALRSSLCALPKRDGQHTRLLYLYTLICMENSVLLCTAFYDRVSNTLHGKQRFYYHYEDLKRIQNTNTRLTDEDTCFKDYLSEPLCERYRQQALKVIALHTGDGEKHCCVLPRQPVATKLFATTGHHARLTRYIMRDVDKMTAGLSSRI